MSKRPPIHVKIGDSKRPPARKAGRRPSPTPGQAFDASSSVRLCDRCEDEYGVAAGADEGDRACAVCGRHEAPHVYPASPLPAGGLSEEELSVIERSCVARWIEGSWNDQLLKQALAKLRLVSAPNREEGDG